MQFIQFILPKYNPLTGFFFFFIEIDNNMNQVLCGFGFPALSSRLQHQGFTAQQTQSQAYIQYSMVDINVAKEVQSILKEGFLDKESRFLKQWRSRWFVLTPQTLMTFKERKAYNSPTEVIALREVTSIKSADQETNKTFSFRIDTGEAIYYVAASSNAEKQQWIGQIGKTMVKLSTKMDD